MKPQRIAGPLMLVVVGAVVIALGGCDRGTPTAQPSPSASADDARTALLNLAKCMRENGYPTFPDPVQNEGRWDFPADSADIPERIDVPACNDLVRDSKQALRAANAPSAEEMAKLREYAKCMREHGMPSFPDPDTSGNFDVPQDQRDDPARGAAHESCKQYAPPPRPK